jgi:4'-phosphopantetheinyl transferase
MICVVRDARMTTKLIWRRQTPEFEFIHDEVHVWRARLGLHTEMLERLRANLKPEERARAARFVFPTDGNNFVVARGILRELLGAYTQCLPGELDFAYGPQGKPSLRTMHGGSTVRFNLSHSHGLAVYAFSRHRALGIDIELIQPNFAGEEIAQRFFSPAELAELRSLPPELRNTGFFTCWTRKEAYVKAREEGLQIPLASFDVSLRPEKPEVLRCDDSFRWELHSFEPAPQFVGALVTEGKDAQVRCWEWRP